MRVVPDRVTRGGGTALRIEGDDFAGHGPAAVYVGTRSAKAIIVESRWLIRAVSGETDELGPVDVQISFSDGTSHVIEQAVTIEEETGVVLRPGGKPR